MKRIIYAVIAVLFMAGCENREEIVPVEVTKLELSEEEFIISSEGKDFSVDVTCSGTYDVKIEALGGEWIHKVTSKAVDGVLTFRVDKNDEYSDRYALIEVSASDITRYIRVIQKQRGALILSKNQYEVDRQGGEFSVEVISNVDVRVSIDDEMSSWLTPIYSKGISSETYHFSISSYKGKNTRSGTIVFSGDGVEEKLTVYQTGVPTIVLSNNLINVSDNGGTVSVDVSSNVEYEVVMPENDWISYVPTVKSMVTNSLEFYVDANESYDPREAMIEIRGIDSNLSETIRIVQSQKGAIVVGMSVVELTADGGMFSLEVGSSVDYEISIDSDWVRPLQTKAFVEKELLFSYDRNVNPYVREAWITFTDGNVSQKVKVVQNMRLRDYVMYVTHDNPSFTLPKFTGTITSGMIYWGDGYYDHYTENLVHNYYDAGYSKTVEIILQGGEDEHIVKFNDIVGIKEIDLSGM